MDRKTQQDAAAIVLAKIGVALLAIHFGFSHVSDDDYARTVISERFAHSPSLDPSQTSWLPFPFWLTGSAMIAFGRTLEVARAMAIAASACSSAAVYFALRAAQVGRAPAIVATAFAMALPWSAWLGATNVPEGYAAALIVAGMVTTNAPSLRARSLGAAALLAASLSRYEAWPVCATFFFAGLSPSFSMKRTAVHAAPLAGPLAWMAWNLHAHGSATHFLSRVAAYRDAIGAGDSTLEGGLATYAKALLEIGVEPIFLGSIGLVAFCMRRDLRERWSQPLVASAALFAFLIYGESRGGAPTHHPERALLAVAWVLVAFGVDAIFTLLAKAKRRASIAAAAVLALWTATLGARYARAPGQSADEDRTSQIARGLDLRARDVRHVVIAPCAYEHFALIAAFGSPERVDVAAVSPADAVSHRAIASCPSVREEARE